MIIKIVTKKSGEQFSIWLVNKKWEKKMKSLANNLCNKKLYIVLDLDVMAKNQGVGSKVILCKSCCELFLFLQCITCIFGPAQAL